MTVAGGIENGFLHVVPGSNDPRRVILDLLPSQMYEAVVNAPSELYSVADWRGTWNTSSSATRPTAFQYLCILLHDYLSSPTGTLQFDASDGAELCAAWSVIRAIQKGEPSTVLGPSAAFISTQDVVLESYQIRTPALDNQTTLQLHKQFTVRVQELRQQGADHWTVLLPPMEWPDVDVYVVFPRSGVAGSSSVKQSHLVGVSVKSYAGRLRKQLQSLKQRARNAKSKSGSMGVRSESFVVCLGYDLGTNQTMDPICDFVVTPSTIRDLVPLSVMSLCLLTAEFRNGAR
jgi:hypothetical protein